MRIKTVTTILQNYTDGKIAQTDELEEKLLDVHGDVDATYQNELLNVPYLLTISAGRLDYFIL